MGYYWFYWLIIVHSIAAVIAVGPLALNPWLANQIIRSRDNRPLLRTLYITDIFYNRGGWILILSGVALFYLTDWHRAFHAWFLICIGLFVVDSIVERRIREPALTDLSGLTEHHAAWRTSALRLRRGVWVQTASAYLILILMLVRPNLG